MSVFMFIYLFVNHCITVVNAPWVYSSILLYSLLAVIPHTSFLKLSVLHFLGHVLCIVGSVVNSYLSIVSVFGSIAMYWLDISVESLVCIF